MYIPHQSSTQVIKRGVGGNCGKKKKAKKIRGKERARSRRGM
jgi:hypothetical protein